MESTSVDISQWQDINWQLLNYWDIGGNEATIGHIPREANLTTNEMAHRASGAHVQEQGPQMKVKI